MRGGGPGQEQQSRREAVQAAVVPAQARRDGDRGGVRQRAGAAQRLVDVGCGEGAGEAQQCVVVGAVRQVAGQAAECEGPAAVLLAGQRAGAGDLSGRCHHQGEFRAGRSGRQAVAPAHRADAPGRADGPGLGQSEAGQPAWAAGGGAGGVDHEVGLHGLFAFLVGEYPDPGDLPAVGGGEQSGDGGAVDDAHAGQVAQPPAQCAVEGLRADRQGEPSARSRLQPPSAEVPAAVPEDVADRGAALLEGLDEAGQETVEGLPAAGVQGVRCSGQGADTGRAGRDAVLFQHGDPAEGVGQHPGRQQSGGAGADDDGVAAAG